MLKGFQLEIQKDLSDNEQAEAIRFANEWISKTCGNNLIFNLGGRTGGWCSFLKRNRFGFMNSKTNDLVFRRISTDRRVFGIVKSDTMIKPDGSEINLNQCMCPIHRGAERVIWRGGKKPSTFIYAVVGDLKG